MFRNQISTETEIDGTPEKVWAVLTDFAGYADWNPGFEEAEGRAQVGETLHLTFAKEGGRGMRMHPKVLVAEPGRELRWLGRLWMPGIFDGEHRFEIQELAPGRVRFVQSERFSGVLVGLFRSTLDKTRLGFAEMNGALKLRAEGRV